MDIKNRKGITLIALVVTLIVLLILASVSIAMISGQNGIISNAKKSVTQYEEEADKEQQTLDEIGEIISKDTEHTDNILEILIRTEKKIQEIEGQLCNAHEILNRCDAISNQAIYTAMNTETRNELKEELDELMIELHKIMPSSNEYIVNGLEGEGFGVIKIGLITYEELREGENGLFIDVSSKEDAIKTKDSIENAIELINIERSKLGAKQNRIDYSISYYREIRRIQRTMEASDIKNIMFAKNGLQTLNKILKRIEMINLQYAEDEIILHEFNELYDEVKRILDYTRNKDNMYLLNGDWKNEVNINLSSLGIEGLLEKIKTNTNEATSDIQNAIKIIEDLLIKVESLK
ncbi:MAG: hypothetical protein HFJ55_07365 [Clostridia bacterium]|nr:hypothetical protein [Clostridia bacterium]